MLGRWGGGRAGGTSRNTHLPVLETKKGRQGRGWGRRGMEEKGKETQKTIYQNLFTKYSGFCWEAGTKFADGVKRKETSRNELRKRRRCWVREKGNRGVQEKEGQAGRQGRELEEGYRCQYPSACSFTGHSFLRLINQPTNHPAFLIPSVRLSPLLAPATSTCCLNLQAPLPPFLLSPVHLNTHASLPPLLFSSSCHFFILTIAQSSFTHHMCILFFSLLL